MQNSTTAIPDHNSTGKGAFIVGLIGLILSFIPFIGFVAWLLGPLAIIMGLIALRKPPRGLAIAGIVTGGLALLICFWWIGLTKTVGESMNKDAFTPTGVATATADAPIMDATIGGIWTDMEANKIAAGTKYGGHRLRFTNVAIRDFEGDAKSPTLTFEGKREEYLIHMVSASFGEEDGSKIGGLKKGQKITFVCDTVKETFGDGYSLSGCKLS